MFFSALSWSSGRAVFWTFFSLFSVTMLPLIHLWLGGTASALNFVSPGFAMANASAPVIGTPAAGFSGHWAWLGSGLAVSGMLLVLASWIYLAPLARDQAKTTDPQLGRSGPTVTVYSPSAERQSGSDTERQPGRLLVGVARALHFAQFLGGC